MIDIYELRRLCNAATPAPWKYVDNGFDGLIESEDGTFSIGGEPCDGRIEDGPDTQFIIRSREALPAALDEIERLRVALDGMGRYKQFAERIASLNDRNSCADSRTCAVKPGWGRAVRINCYLWRGAL